MLWCVRIFFQLPTRIISELFYMYNTIQKLQRLKWRFKHYLLHYN
jgi:hypothetical protein